MSAHIFLLHTLPDTHHYFPLWTQGLVIAGTGQSLKSKPHHPPCRGCSLDDESSPTVLHYPFHRVPRAADIYLQLNENLQVANEPPTIEVLVPGVWALGASRLRDRKTPSLLHTWISESWAFGTLIWEQGQKQAPWRSGVTDRGKEWAPMERLRFIPAEAQGWGRELPTTTLLSRAGKKAAIASAL